MSANNLSEQMRGDWNARALEDAYYYAAFGGKGQSDSDHVSNLGDVVAMCDIDAPY